MLDPKPSQCELLNSVRKKIIIKKTTIKDKMKTIT